MALTLADLLASRRLELRLAGTAEGNHGEPIQWAAVTELDDPLPFLGGGEVVLTTGLRQKTAAAQRRFVSRVHEARALAVGYGTGLSHPAVPAAAVQQANALGLPIFEVPYNTPFVAISRMIADAISADHLSRLELLLKSHQRLAGALLAGGGLPDLLTELAALLHTDVELFQYGARLAGSAPVPGARPDTSGSGGRSGGAGSGSGGSGTGNGSGEGPRWHRVPIATGLKDRCTLIIAEPYQHGGIVDYAQSLISVELSNQALRRAGTRTAAGQVLHDIIRGTLAGQDAVVRLEALGVPPTGPQSVFVVEVASGQVRALRTLPLPAGFDTVVPAVLEDRLVIVAPRLDGPGGTAGPSAGAGSRRATVPPGTLRLAEQLKDYLYGAGFTARIGVGGSYAHPRGLRWSYFEAKDAARRGAGLNLPERLSLTSLLLAAEDVPLADLAAEALEPLAAFDAAHGAGLMATLESYLELNGSVGAVAEALNLHRNTVRYRLAQIVALSGYDPAVTADRAHLWLALSIRNTA